MVLLDPILDIANAFFGAFFGFWVSQYMSQLGALEVGTLPIAGVLVAILLSLSLQILGFASVLGLGTDPLASTVAKKAMSNVVALALFAIPMCVAACQLQSMQAMSVFGIIIYIWWLAVLFGSILFRSEEQGSRT